MMVFWLPGYLSASRCELRAIERADADEFLLDEGFSFMQDDDKG